MKKAMVGLGALVALASVEVTAHAAAIATLESVIGKVVVKLSDSAQQMEASAGLRLPPGAIVATGVNGRAVIRFSQTDIIRLSGSTQMRILQNDPPEQPGALTLVKALLGSIRARLVRSSAERKSNFGIVAGNAVCAVKGTDFEVTKPKTGDPTFMVNTGNIRVGRMVDANNPSGSFLKIAASGRSLAEGFMMSVPVSGVVPAPRVAPMKSHLEVISGKVIVTIGGKKVEKGPGEEVPMGADVKVSGDSALLAGSKVAVEGADGAHFTVLGDAKGTGKQIMVSAKPDSGMLTVDTGAELVPIDPGTSIMATQAWGAESTVTQVANPTAAQLAAAQKAEAGAGTGEIASAPKTEATKTEETRTETKTPVKEEAPPPPQEPTGEAGDIGVLPLIPEPELPALPPETPNQDIQVVSPIAP